MFYSPHEQPISSHTTYPTADETMADKEESAPDYSLANPETLTQYKTAGQISQKALEAVTGIDRTT